MEVVECVPNFSEGRDDTVIGAIAAAIAAVPSVHLLDVDKGWGANRTVMTFAGAQAGVEEAAFQAIKTAAQHIDMRRHKGAHPRLGATDVCPFVPLSHVSMNDCIKMAERVGERVAKELSIPVFLYGEAAKMPERKSLPEVRRGEYEFLKERFLTPGSEPDFGEAKVNECSGATILGARGVLIAYNINLKSKSKQVASRLAGIIRESGAVDRDADGGIILKPDGVPRRKKGLLKAVRAVGWFVEEFDCVQVSTNLVDFNVTSLHQVYEEVKRQARLFDVEVSGSELVGLVPLRALIEAGKFYAGQEKQEFYGLESTEKSTDKLTEKLTEKLIKLAVKSLGLQVVREFDSEKKILDFKLRHLGMPVSL